MSDGPSDGASASRVVPEWLSLESDETVVWNGGPRIQTAHPSIVVALIGVVLGGLALVIDAIPWPVSFLAPITASFAAWFFLRVVRTAFVITSDAVYARSGVIGVRVTAIDLDRVQNTVTSQHALGRAIGYGTVTIDTAGGDGAELRFWNVEDPDRIRSLVDSQVDRTRGDPVPGTLEQWETILAEVERWRTRVERESA